MIPEKITSAASLKEAIAQLRARKAEQGTELSEQAKVTYESLNLLTMIKNSVLGFAEKPQDMVGPVISLASGYLSKKIMVGGTHNPLKKLGGILLQIGVSSFVSKNTDHIRDTAARFLKKIFPAKGPGGTDETAK